MSAPLALTLPTDGGASTRRVLLRFLKKVARDAFELPVDAAGPALEPTTRRALALLRELAERDRAAVLAVLRRPQVHGLLETALAALAQRDGAALRDRAGAFVLQLLFELALDGALPPGGLSFDAAPPRRWLASPAHRARVALPDAPALRFTNAGLAPVTRAGDGEETSWSALAARDAFVPVVGGVVLALVDNNPISDFEAHPDKTGNQLDLGAAPAEAWVASLAGALALVGEHLPALRAEMDRVLQQFVPVGTDEHRHLSASYKESVGTVYLTLHPKRITMTEAVIHEYQHNKLNMLLHLDEVMHNAYWPLYRSPVRPDPRPLHGVLLAAHAFVPVAELYRRLAESGHAEAQAGGFAGRFDDIVTKNAEALEVLNAHAAPTAAGRQLLDELNGLHEGHRVYLGRAS